MWRSVVMHPEATFFSLSASTAEGSPEVLGSDAVLLGREDAISAFRFPGPVVSIRHLERVRNHAYHLLRPEGRASSFRQIKPPTVLRPAFHRLFHSRTT